MGKPNTIGLGKKQKELLQRMEKEDLRIVAMHDYHAGILDIELQSSDGEDILESINPKLLDSLYKRKLFTKMAWLPSLGIEIITFKLRNYETIL